MSRVESTEQISSIWKLDEPSTHIDRSVEEKNYVEYKTRSPIGAGVQSSTLEVESTDRNNFYLPSESYLDFEVQLRNEADSADLSADDRVVLADSALKIFPKMELYYDTQSIHALDNVGDAHHMHHLVTASKSSADVFETMGYYPDSKTDGATHDVPALAAAWDTALAIKSRVVPYATGADNEVDISKSVIRLANDDFVQNTDYDDSFRRRLARGKRLRFMVPLKELFPALKHYNKVVRGHRLALTASVENDSMKYLYGSYTTGKPKINFHRFSLWVPRIKASVPAQTQLNSFLETSPVISMTYPHINLHVSPRQTAGESQWTIGHEHSRPLYVIFGCQRYDRESNVFLNPSEFDDVLETCHVRVNGQAYPLMEYVNESSDPSRMVADLHAMGGKIGDLDNGSFVNIENFKTNRALYAIDLSKTPNSFWSKKTVANVEIRYKTKPSAVDFRIKALLACEKELEESVISGEMKWRVL